MLFQLDSCTGQVNFRVSASPEALAATLRGEGYVVYGPSRDGRLSFALEGCRDNAATPATSVQRRAVEYGAQDVDPTVAANGIIHWPADEERVSLERITYHPEDDTFSGWSGRPVPEWTEK